MANAGLGTPVRPQGAGLVTMADRQRMVDSLVAQGLTPSAAITEMGSVYGVAPPSTPPASSARSAPAAGDDRVGPLEELWYGARRTAADTARGAGYLLEDQLGVDGAGAVGDAAAGVLGPSATQEEAQQRQSQARQDDVDRGDLSNAGAFAQEVGDSVLQSATSWAPQAAGALAGAAAGTAVAPVVGTAIGAALGWLGGFAANLPQHYAQSRDAAVQNGVDVSTPEAQNKLLAVSSGKDMLDNIVPLKILRTLGMGRAAEEIAAKSIMKHAAKNVTEDALVEAATEAAQEAADILAFDPDAAKRMTKDDWASLAPWLATNYGRQIGLAAASGALMGGVAGGTTGAYQQRMANARLKTDTDRLTAATENMGVDPARLQEAIKTPEGAGDVARAAREISAAEAARAEVEDLYKGLAPEQKADPENVVVKLRAARNKAADDTLDKWVPKFGGMTVAEKAAQVSQQKQQAHDAAVTRAKAAGIEPTVEGLDTATIERVTSPFEEAKARVADLQNSLENAASDKRKVKVGKALTKANAALLEAETEARRVLQGETPEQQAGRRAAQQRKAAVDAHQRSEFGGLPDDEAVIARADEIIANRDSGKGAAKLQARIDQLVEQRRNPDNTAEEITAIDNRIAEARARAGMADPVVEAAYQAKRAAQERLGIAAPSEEEIAAALPEEAGAPGGEPGAAATEAAPENEAAPAPTAEEVSKRREDLQGRIEKMRALRGRSTTPELTATLNAKIAQAQADLDALPPVADAKSDAKRAATPKRSKPKATAEGTEGKQGDKASAAEAKVEPQKAAAQEGQPRALPETPDAYFERTADTVDVPMASLKATRARLGGITRAVDNMAAASAGTGAKRAPISVRDDGDGTYTILDGNSTYAVAKASGWGAMPVRVLTDRQFHEEAAQKWRADTPGADISVKVTNGKASVFVQGPEKLRKTVVARAEAEGVNATFKPTDTAPAAGVPPAHPSRLGHDMPNGPWKPLVDEIGIGRPAAETEAAMRDWTAKSGFEASANIGASGEVLGVGTNSMRNGVMPPAAGYLADGTVFVHTHPSQTPHSGADVAAMFGNRQAACVALLPDGQRVEIRPGDSPVAPAEVERLRDEVMNPALVDAITQPRAPKLQLDQIKQEAFLRFLDAKGVINYATPITGLTATQMEQINDAVDRALDRDAAGADAGDGLRADGRTGTAPVGQDQSNGAERTAPAEEAAREGEAQRERLTRELHPLGYRPTPPDVLADTERQWRETGGKAYGTVEQLLAAATDMNPRFADVMTAAQRAVPGVKFIHAPMKAEGSLRRKLKSKPGRAPGTMADAVRGTFVVDDLADADRVVMHLSSTPGVEVLDEGWATNPISGYTDRKLTVRIGGAPMMMEVQFSLPALLAAKEGVKPWTWTIVDPSPFASGHSEYEVFRDPDNHSPAERETALQNMLDLYRAAVDMSPAPIRSQALAASGRLAAADGNRFRQALSSMDLSASPADAGNGAQPASENQRPPSGDAGSTTTASPSQTANAQATGTSPSATPAGYDITPFVAKALDLRTGADDLSRYGLTPGKTHKTRDIAVAMEARQRDLHGRIERGDFSPEAKAKIAGWMAEEVAFEVEMSRANGNSAVGWYSDKFQRALDVFAKRYPELAPGGSAEGTAFDTPQHARDYLTALIAITSDGEKVMTNFKRAAQLYGAARTTGVLPENTQATRGASMRTNAKVINRLHAEHGAGMKDFLLQQVKVSDVNKQLRAQGLPAISGYQAHMLMPRAALAFGSKLGAFYANLSGADGYLTMDRWWSRTFNRYRGDLVDRPTEAGMARVKQLLAAQEDVSPDMADDVALARSTPYVAAYRAKGFKNGTELEKAANTVYKAAFENLNDTPFGAKDRTFMIETTQAAQQRLAERGIDMSIADMQAVLWYYEKRLYAEMGARASPDVSYEEVANRVIEDANPDGGSAESGPLAAAGIDGPDGAAFEGTDGPGIGEDSVPVDFERAGRGRGSAGTARRSAQLEQPAGYEGRSGVLTDGQTYADAMERAKASLGAEAAQVSRVPPNADVRRFLLDGGTTGYALDGDNIIGVFSSSTAPRGAAQRVLADAVANGGRRLDGFDTFLPKLYARGGFRAVARLAFNPEYAPAEANGALADWDADGMERMHRGWGAPDVVFMVYDPANAAPDTDNVITDYDDGATAQAAALEARSVVPVAGEPAPLYVSRDVTDATALQAWAKEQGFTDLVPPDDMHVTVLYSKAPVDIGEAPADTAPTTGGFKAARPEHLGNALTLPLTDASAMTAGHARYRAVGGSHDYGDEYIPHVTFKYDPTPEDLARAKTVKPFTGTVSLSGEKQARLREGWRPADDTPFVARAVDVPGYLHTGAPTAAGHLAKAQAIAKAPGGFMSKVIDKIEDEMFNAFAPIRRFELAMKGTLGVGFDSAFKAAEMATNDTGRAEMLLNYGAAKFDPQQGIVVAPGTKGLLQIFDDVAATATSKSGRGQAMVDWMAYMAARRAQDLHARGIATPLSAADIQAALAKGSPAFDQAAADWKAHNDANIDFLVDTGRLTKAQATALKADPHYVPFYRTDEQLADGTSPELDLDAYLSAGARAGGFHPNRKNILPGRDPGIKKIVGGDKMAIDNVLTNMIRNSQSMVAAGMRNLAANRTFDMLDQAGLSHTQSATKVGASGKIVRKELPNNAVRMWVGGKEKFVTVTDPTAFPVLKALAGLKPVQLHGIMGLMANVAGIFRQGVTLSPAFMIRNAIRGAVSTGVLTSGSNLSAGNNLFTGMREFYRAGDAAKAFMHNSGMGDYGFGNPTGGFGKNDFLIEYGMAHDTVGHWIRKAVGKAERFGTATELGDRLAAYNRWVANGVRPDEAAYRALTVMNYGRKGGNAWLRQLLPLVPFLNARLQGLSRLAEGAVGRGQAQLTHKQALSQIALNGALLAAASAGIWAMHQDDPDDRDRYRSEPLWKRLNYHILYVGDRTILIPKAFEIGHLFSSIPELALDAAFNDMGDQMAPGLKSIVAQNFMFNAIPAAALPAIEVMTNHDFFTGGEIEGLREDKLLPQDRTEKSTAMSRFIGGGDSGVSARTGLSPNMLEHLANGYGGAYYALLSSAVDMIGADLGLTSAPVGGAFGDVPLASTAAQRAMGSIVRMTDTETDRWLGEFYDTKRYIDQIYGSAKAAALDGDVDRARALMAKAQMLPAARDLTNKAASKLSDINREIRRVKADRTMTSGDKLKQMAPLVQARNKLSQALMIRLRQMEAAQGETFADAAS